MSWSYEMPGPLFIDFTRPGLLVANRSSMASMPPPQVCDPDMHHDTCVTHVPWCMTGSLIGGFLWSRQRGKRSRHSRHMRNPQFYVSCKRPMAFIRRVLTGLHITCAHTTWKNNSPASLSLGEHSNKELSGDCWKFDYWSTLYTIDPPPPPELSTYRSSLWNNIPFNTTMAKITF